MCRKASSISDTIIALIGSSKGMAAAVQSVLDAQIIPP